MHIGKTLKKIRKEKGLKLSELAKMAGIQLATLSRIENLKMRGTVESHMKLARALSIDITHLYENVINNESSIEIKGDNSALDVFSHNEKSSYEILTSNVLSKKMLPTLLKIEPEGKTNIEQNPLGSEKFVYVTQGTVDIHIEDKNFTLNENNSLYFNAALKHYFSNLADTPAAMICVVTPVSL